MTTDTNERIRILGIDPGTNILGYAVITCEKGRILTNEIGVVMLDHLDSHEEKLKRIFERVTAIIHTWKPDACSIETPFFGKNVQSMFKLGRAQGVAIAAAITCGLHIAEYSPKIIKKAVTGNGNASKEQVAALLRQMLQISLDDINHTFDATDALATAVCHYHRRTGARTGKQTYTSWAAFAKANEKRISRKA